MPALMTKSGRDQSKRSLPLSIFQASRLGAFSYAKSQVADVVRYIQNQEIHHQRKTFRQEYHQLLEKFEIPFEEKYLFDFIE